MPPLLQAETLFAPNRPVISFDPAAVRERLTSQQRQIFDDHAPYDCLQLTVSDGSDHAFLVVKRRTTAQCEATGRTGESFARADPLFGHPTLQCAGAAVAASRAHQASDTATTADGGARRAGAALSGPATRRDAPGAHVLHRILYIAIQFMMHSSELMPGGSPYYPSIELVDNYIGI